MQSEENSKGEKHSAASKATFIPKETKPSSPPSEVSGKGEQMFSPDKTQSSMHSSTSMAIEVSEKVAVKSTRKKIEQDIQLLK